MTLKFFKSQTHACNNEFYQLALANIPKSCDGNRKFKLCDFQLWAQNASHFYTGIMGNAKSRTARNFALQYNKIDSEISQLEKGQNPVDFLIKWTDDLERYVVNYRETVKVVRYAQVLEMIFRETFEEQDPRRKKDLRK